MGSKFCNWPGTLDSLRNTDKNIQKGLDQLKKIYVTDSTGGDVPMEVHASLNTNAEFVGSMDTEAIIATN